MPLFRKPSDRLQGCERCQSRLGVIYKRVREFARPKQSMTPLSRYMAWRHMCMKHDGEGRVGLLMLDISPLLASEAKDWDEGRLTLASQSLRAEHSL